MTWPKPYGFRELSTITETSIHVHGYSRRNADTAARLAGLRFEEKVQGFFLSHYPNYSAEPHIRYKEVKHWRNAFPDGLMLLSDRSIIFEIKRQHMPEAWWQLRKRYQPLLEHHRVQPVQVIEVVKDFDLQMPFPEDVDVLTLDEFPRLLREPHSSRFSVLVWPR